MLVDPYGNLLISYSTNQLRRIEVTGGVGFATAPVEPPVDPPMEPGQAAFTVGIDFDSAGAVFPDPAPAVTPPSAASGFNEFSIQTADGASASFSGTLNDVTGSAVAGLGFSVQNNSGKDFGLTGVTGLSGPGIFNDATIFSDSYGAANVGNAARADGGNLAAEGNFVFTFSGLDDSLTYDVTGGYDQDNANFNTIWEATGTANAAIAAYSTKLPSQGG